MSESAATVVETGALYNRYRPSTMAEVVGQDHVMGPLSRALEKGKAHHAYLFSGPAGCGKTTTARIVAAAMVCDAAPTATPCGQCVSCQAVAAGNCLDIIEIDAASQGSVEDARNLREKVMFAPVNSAVKVVIIDEAHMITTQGFNALLKVVEEPPAHVRFIFATTDPDKVIATIRSRTYNYRFRLVPPAVLAEYLTKVAALEGGSVDDGVLPLLLRVGGGSVRSSLGLLGQLLDGSFGGRVTREDAVALLGATSDAVLDDMVTALADRDAAGMLRAVGTAIDEGSDPKRLCEDLLDRLRDLLLLATTGQVPPLAEIAGPSRVAGWRDVATRLGLRGLTSAAESLQVAMHTLPGGAAGRIGLEVACMRMQIDVVDGVDLPALMGRIEKALASGSTLTVQAVAPAAAPAPTPVVTEPAPVTAPAPAPAPVAAEPTPVTPPAVTVPAVPVDEWAPPADEPPASAVDDDPWVPPADADAMNDRYGSAATPTPVTASAAGPVDSGSWDTILQAILSRPRGRITHTLLSGNATVARIGDGQIVLRFTNAALAKTARDGGHLTVCGDAAATVLGGRWTVSVEGGA